MGWEGKIAFFTFEMENMYEGAHTLLNTGEQGSIEWKKVT